jgi:hypothetical protein
MEPGPKVTRLTGFFGVGGGFIVVPALVFVLRYEMPVAVGTCLLVIAINSSVALLARSHGARIEWHVALPFAVAALFGVGVGERVATRVAFGGACALFRYPSRHGGDVHGAAVGTCALTRSLERWRATIWNP